MQPLVPATPSVAHTVPGPFSFAATHPDTHKTWLGIATLPNGVFTLEALRAPATAPAAPASAVPCVLDAVALPSGIVTLSAESVAELTRWDGNTGAVVDELSVKSVVFQAHALHAVGDDVVVVTGSGGVVVVKLHGPPYSDMALLRRLLTLEESEAVVSAASRCFPLVFGACAASETLCVWDVGMPSGAPVASVALSWGEPLSLAVVDGPLVAVGGEDGVIEVFDASDAGLGVLPKLRDLGGHESPVGLMAACGGSHLAAASWQPVVTLHDARTGDPLARFADLPPNRIQCFANVDGKVLFASASYLYALTWRRHLAMLHLGDAVLADAPNVMVVHVPATDQVVVCRVGTPPRFVHLYPAWGRRRDAVHTLVAAGKARLGGGIEVAGAPLPVVHSAGDSDACPAAAAAAQVLHQATAAAVPAALAAARAHVGAGSAGWMVSELLAGRQPVGAAPPDVRWRDLVGVFAHKRVSRGRAADWELLSDLGRDIARFL